MGSQRRHTGTGADDVAGLPGSADLPSRPVVLESWKRCMRLGVDPGAGAAPIVLTPEELAGHREAHPLSLLMPLVRQLLVEDAVDGGFVVAVADAQGRLLWVEGDHGLRSRAEAMHFVEGGLWTEAAAGTNAPGTALALGRAVRVSATEHFGEPVRRWSCAAAPVRDLRTGKVLGVIDVTGGPDIGDARSLAMVRACAAAMEAHLPGLVGTDGTVRVPRPAVGEAGAGGPARSGAVLEVLGRAGARLTVPDADALVLSPRHSEIVWLLAEHPRGLTSQELEARLHPDGDHRVAVRAEFVRLRRLLTAHGLPDLLRSRPYRLDIAMDSDVSQLRTLLARGAVRRAMARFEGAPLPASEAPGVVRLREEFLAEVRVAVLGSGSADALHRWTSDAAGAADAEAWQSLVRALPYGSPRRARARAHLLRLDEMAVAPARATFMQPPTS